MMPTYQHDEIKQFLTAIDKRLTQPFELIIIGGSAGVLAYGVQRATKDIDTLTPDFVMIMEAITAAKKETGLNIPVEYPGVEDYPIEIESRLQLVQKLNKNFSNLTVKVPEKHDLVLMKAIRGEQPDWESALEIKELIGLDFDILVNRYLNEMYPIGRIERIDLNFLGVIDFVFGDAEREIAKKRIIASRKKRN